MENTSSTESSTSSNSDDNSIVVPNFVLLDKMCNNLESIIQEYKTLVNYQEKLKSQKNFIFNSKVKPCLPLREYLFRLQQLTQASDNIFISSLIYVDRFIEKNDLVLTEKNVYRILFLSVIISIKYNEDIKINSFKYLAKIGGISLKELKKLEYYYLKLIDYELFVEKKQFEKYKTFIENIKCEYNNVKEKEIKDIN